MAGERQENYGASPVAGTAEVLAGELDGNFSARPPECQGRVTGLPWLCHESCIGCVFFLESVPEITQLGRNALFNFQGRKSVSGSPCPWTFTTEEK